MKNLQVFNGLTGINEVYIKEYIKRFKKENDNKLINNNNYLLFIRMNDIYTNELDDYCFYLDDKKDILLCMRCTTKAGHYYVYNPITYGGINGTAVLSEGIYYNSHTVVGTYRFGFYDLEIIQTSPLIIFRDSNRNKKLDRDKKQYGMFGINIHTSGLSTIIDRWSAGCLAIYKKEWDWFKNKYLKLGDKFSIELITLEQFKKKI